MRDRARRKRGIWEESVENWITWSSALEEGGVAGEVASYYIRVGPFCHELMFRMAAQVFPGYPAGRRLLRLQRGGQHLDYT